MRSIATDIARSVVCVSVCWSYWCRPTVQNGWTDRDAVLGADTCMSKEQCVTWGSRWDESIRIRAGWQVGDAAFCQITVDNC